VSVPAAACDTPFILLLISIGSRCALKLLSLCFGLNPAPPLSLASSMRPPHPTPSHPPRHVRACTSTEIDIIAKQGDRGGDPPPPGAREGDEALQITGSPQVGGCGWTILVASLRSEMQNAY